jgi:predicted ATP-binding protein involved in virulence
MHIDGLSMQNYRCFEKLDVSFQQQMTVIVGKNGSGKSTILDAVRVALEAYLWSVDVPNGCGIHADDVRHTSISNGDAILLEQQFPATVAAEGSISDRAVRWSRSLLKPNGKTTQKDTKEVIALGDELKRGVRSGRQDIILPIVSYYGTGRLWAQKRMKSMEMRSKQSRSRLYGYTDCLDSKSNEKMMLQWFQQQAFIEWQEKMTVSTFSAVKMAVAKIFDHMNGLQNSELRFNAKEQQLEIVYTDDGGDQRAPLNELSDGYRSTLSMVADIATRMAMLNPHLMQDVTERTPGIVLIDEIDLHLHPKWQQRVLDDLMEIFPEVQFIVTTHAPSVINTVKNIILLENNQAYSLGTNTYGRDANSILDTILGVKTRPQNIEDKFQKLYNMLDDEDWKAANIAIDELEELIGPNDPDLISAKITLELESEMY